MIDLRDLEQGEPIEYDSRDDLTLEEHEQMRLAERIEEDRRRHLDAVLWNQFSGHYGRDGQLVIPIRHHGEE